MFLVRPCYNSDMEEVDRFLKEVYYPEEPLTRANRLHGDMPGLTKAILPQGHSVVAVSEVGLVVGVALNDEPPQNFPNIYTKSSEDVKEMFSYMERQSGVLEAAPGALEVRMLAVSAEWRHRGVATALLAATRGAAQGGAFPFMKMYCTSAHSGRLMSKLGWTLLYSLPYRLYLDQHPSGMVLPPEPHTSCALFIDRVEGYRSGLDQLAVAVDSVMPIRRKILHSSMVVQN